MSAALRAEWTKLRTLPGTGWLLLGVVAATVIISAAVSASVSCSSPASCHVDVTKLRASEPGPSRRHRCRAASTPRAARSR